MPNTHAVADFAYELQATCEDLLPACIVSTTWPTVPVSSMTLAAFGTLGYVRDGHALVYVEQPSITVPLSGSDGTYWLGMTRDVSTAYAGWTRRAGSSYVWRLSGTRPPDVDGLLVFASCTVAGGIITAVTPAPGVTRAEAWRALSGLGTMATQHANAVAITGGTAALTTAQVGWTAEPGYQLTVNQLYAAGASHFQYPVGLGTAPVAGYALTTGVGASLFNGPVGVMLAVPAGFDLATDRFYTNGASRLNGPIGCGTAPDLSGINQVTIGYGNLSVQTQAFKPGGGPFADSSDARLKTAIQEIPDALGILTALHGITYRWRDPVKRGGRTGSYFGLIAQEVQPVIPGWVSTGPDTYLQLEIQGFEGLTVEALKQLVSRMSELETRLAALEGGT